MTDTGGVSVIAAYDSHAANKNAAEGRELESPGRKAWEWFNGELLPKGPTGRNYAINAGLETRRTCRRRKLIICCQKKRTVSQSGTFFSKWDEVAAARR